MRHALSTCNGVAVLAFRACDGSTPWKKGFEKIRRSEVAGTRGTKEGETLLGCTANALRTAFGATI